MSVLFFEELNTSENEFYSAIDLALDVIYGILAEHPSAEWWIEQYVDPPIGSAPGEAGGYCDVGIYCPVTMTLWVIDYKHGKGIAKDAECNTQILQYGVGFMFDPNSPAYGKKVEQVCLMIVQPRAFHELGSVRDVWLPGFHMWAELGHLDADIAECLEPDAPLTAGPWCKDTFCDAYAHCPARKELALKPLAAAGQVLQRVDDARPKELPAPETLTPERLALIRTHAPDLRKWLDACEDHAYQLARSGTPIAGAKLVEAQAKRVYFGSEQETAKRLAALIGVQETEVYETKLPAITKAEKRVVDAFTARAGAGGKKKAAEKAKAEFAQLTLKQSSGNLVLVDVSDKRPEFQSLDKAQAAFGGIAGLIPKQ